VLLDALDSALHKLAIGALEHGGVLQAELLGEGLVNNRQRAADAVEKGAATVDADDVGLATRQQAVGDDDAGVAEADHGHGGLLRHRRHGCCTRRRTLA